MSNHQRVYEGTLHWPMVMNDLGLACRAPAGESLPPWGLSEEDQDSPANMCGMIITGRQHLDLDDIKDDVEKHMREAHGEEV